MVTLRKRKKGIIYLHAPVVLCSNHKKMRSKLVHISDSAIKQTRITSILIKFSALISSEPMPVDMANISAAIFNPIRFFGV